MVIHDNEVLGPEHLAELGTLFDQAWAAFGSATCVRAERRINRVC